MTEPDQTVPSHGPGPLDETVPSAPPQGAPPTPPPPTVSKVGPYSVDRELARGGQGAVLSASHETLGTRAAIKVLLDTSATAVARFQQEAQLLARLRHRNLPTVSDMGVANGQPYIAMELIEGRDLKAVVAQGGVPEWSWTADVLCDVADVLHYCHGHGVVHRDVKPANILIERVTGRPVLVDFGLAKPEAETPGLSLAERAERLSLTGEIKGTPSFMAPEQAAPEFGEVGPATDVYALGGTLFFLLTGQPPYSGSSLFGLLHKVMEAPVPDPVALNPEVPLPLADLCRRALAKTPAERPSSAATFAAELRAATSNRASLSEASTLKLVLRLHPRKLAMAAVLLAGAAGGGIGFFFRREGELQTEQRIRRTVEAARRDMWGLTQRMLGGGALTADELDSLSLQAVNQGDAPWKKWLPYVHARNEIVSGAAIADVLRKLPLGPDRDLIELDARGVTIEDDARLLQLASSAAKSQLPWRGDAVERWDRLAAELAYQGRDRTAASALASAIDLLAERGADPERILDRLGQAGEFDVQVVHERSRHHAPLLVQAARRVLERTRPPLGAEDAPAVARARSRLVLFRMLEPNQALPATTLEALERLADRKVHGLREAVLPRDSWTFRLRHLRAHRAGLAKGEISDALREQASPVRAAHMVVHMDRYWLLFLPNKNRRLWNNLALAARILGQFHIAQRALEISGVRSEGLPLKDRIYSEQRLGHVHYRQRNYDAALAILEPHMAHPRHLTIWSRLRLARALLASRRFERAEQVLETLADVKFWTDREAFWWLRGDIMEALGRPEPAKNCWREAARISSKRR